MLAHVFFNPYSKAYHVYNKQSLKSVIVGGSLYKIIIHVMFIEN